MKNALYFLLSSVALVASSGALFGDELGAILRVRRDSSAPHLRTLELLPLASGKQNDNTDSISSSLSSPSSFILILKRQR